MYVMLDKYASDFFVDWSDFDVFVSLLSPYFVTDAVRAEDCWKVNVLLVDDNKYISSKVKRVGSLKGSILSCVEFLSKVHNIMGAEYRGICYQGNDLYLVFSKKDVPRSLLTDKFEYVFVREDGKRRR